MENKFIYIFDDDSATKILDAGYVLMKQDESSHIYVFKWDESMKQLLTDVEFMLSNMLTF